MSDAELTPLVEKLSRSYGVPDSWVKAIIQQESQWNIYAVRYEVNYSYLYRTEHFAKHPLISLSTEIATQKISWGLGQLMGAVAREQGHSGLMGELLIPETNIRHICIKLMMLQKISSEKDDIFAMYNGGQSAVHKINGSYRNKTYVDSVNRHLQIYEGSSKIKSKGENP